MPAAQAVLSGLLGGGLKPPKPKVRGQSPEAAAAEAAAERWQDLISGFLAAGGAGDQGATLAEAVVNALNGTLPVVELLPLLGAAAEQLDLPATPLAG